MRIAIATDDKKTVRRGHFGDAEFYAIYDGENFVEFRENPYTDEKLGITKHDDPRKAKLIAEFLADCQVLVGSSHGRKNIERVKQTGKRFVKVPWGTPIEEALKKALEGEDA